ncbi:MAG TPA: Asp23/Gls24 family envelope stress response protein [Frankiaceae bacterium]
MSTPTTTASLPSTSGGAAGEHGHTLIADAVVQKIAGVAAREIGGVHDLGSGAARALGAVRERIPGAGQPNVTQGVRVEVGETQAAVDLNVIVEYGVAIVELAAAIRRNVIGNIERMTGLQVTEVNISVDDVHLATEDDGSQEPSRVA